MIRCRRNEQMKTTLKDWPKVYQRIRGMRSLSEDKKILFARHAAATPDERWQMNVNYLRSVGSWGRCALKKSDSR